MIFLKNTIIFFFIIIIVYVIIGNIVSANNLIPEDAIRIRIIPNSNSVYDQKIKQKVKEEVQTDMYELLKNTKGSSDAKRLITSHIDMLDSKIDNLLKSENYNKPYSINYGLNYFPEKEYKGIKYNEGYYESLVVTIGAGEGDNWWCVLFPPLCLIEAEESTDVEYTSFVKEMVDKYL